MEDKNKPTFEDLRKKYDLRFNKNTTNLSDYEILSNFDNEKIRTDIILLEQKYNQKKVYLNQLKKNIDEGENNSEKVKKKIEYELEPLQKNLAKLESLSNSMNHIIDEIEKKEEDILKNTSYLKDIMNSDQAKEVIFNIKTITEKINNLKVFL